jgi:hypothetical protein
MEYTTLKSTKELRNKLMTLKYELGLKTTHEVVQFLYSNYKDADKLHQEQ